MISPTGENSIMSSRIDEKHLHYESIKTYFREDLTIKNGYFDSGKKSKSQQKTFDICIQILEDLVAQNNGMNSLLDAGCGTGDITCEFHHKFPQFTEIVGIDFLPEVISTAQDKKPDKYVWFLQADILDTPFDDRRFDVTICLDVLHHIHRDDFKTAIRELTRITDKYLIIDIRNKKNLFDGWYTHIVHPLLYNNLPIYTTSMDSVTTLAREQQFELYLVQRIESSRFFVRRLILVYERND